VFPDALNRHRTPELRAADAREQHCQRQYGRCRWRADGDHRHV